MPILGNLAEFPLPEILLLIGQRSGRLRLLDVPGSDHGLIDIDIGQGQIYAMNLSGRHVLDEDPITHTLTTVVQSGGGMFEFTILHVPTVSRPHPILINQLVMSLVFKVDENEAEKKSQDTPDDVYVLEKPDPEMWIEPDLAQFFMRAKDLLQHGARWEDLAKHLDMDVEQVRENLTNLRLLGVVNLMDEMEREARSVPIKIPSESITSKSRLFPQVTQAAQELQRLTGRMPKFIPTEK